MSGGSIVQHCTTHGGPVLRWGGLKLRRDWWRGGGRWVGGWRRGWRSGWPATHSATHAATQVFFPSSSLAAAHNHQQTPISLHTQPQHHGRPWLAPPRRFRQRDRRRGGRRARKPAAAACGAAGAAVPDAAPFSSHRPPGGAAVPPARLCRGGEAHGQRRSARCQAGHGAASPRATTPGALRWSVAAVRRRGSAAHASSPHLGRVHSAPPHAARGTPARPHTPGGRRRAAHSAPGSRWATCAPHAGDATAPESRC